MKSAKELLGAIFQDEEFLKELQDIPELASIHIRQRIGSPGWTRTDVLDPVDYEQVIRSARQVSEYCSDDFVKMYLWNWIENEFSGTDIQSTILPVVGLDSHCRTISEMRSSNPKGWSILTDDDNQFPYEILNGEHFCLSIGSKKLPDSVGDKGDVNHQGSSVWVKLTTDSWLAERHEYACESFARVASVIASVFLSAGHFEPEIFIDWSEKELMDQNRKWESIGLTARSEPSMRKSIRVNGQFGLGVLRHAVRSHFVVLTKNDCANQGVDYKLYNRLHIAIRLIVQAFESTDPAIRMMLSVASVEAMLGKQAESVTENLSQRLSVFESPTLDDRKKYKKAYKKMYNVRCDLVHGRIACIADDQASEWILTACSVLQKCYAWIDHRNKRDTVPSHKSLIDEIDVCWGRDDGTLPATTMSAIRRDVGDYL